MSEFSDTALNDELATLRGSDDAPPSEAMKALFDAVASETVDKKTTLRDRLRELSTPVRISLAIAGGLVMAAVALVVTGMRTDISGQAILRYGIAMTAIAGLMGAALAVSLRGMHQSPLGRGSWALILAALAVPLLLAVMPWLWDTGTPLPMMAGGGHWACLGLGLMTGALTAAVSWAFQRQSWHVLWRLVAAASAGGLTAFALLQLHCPSTDATHLLVAHAGVGLMLAFAAIVVLRLRRPT